MVKRILAKKNHQTYRSMQCNTMQCVLFIPTCIPNTKLNNPVYKFINTLATFMILKVYQKSPNFRHVTIVGYFLKERKNMQ